MEDEASTTRRMDRKRDADRKKTSFKNHHPKSGIGRVAEKKEGSSKEQLKYDRGLRGWALILFLYKLTGTEGQAGRRTDGHN